MTQIPTWSGGPASPPTGRAAPGTTIGGRYSLRSPVGNGGMGTVWRATDTLLRRDVAVKEVVLPPGLAPSDRDALYERTLREARAAAAIQHPAVVQVYDVVTEGGRPWIVMELLDARSLADMVIEDGPVAPRAVAKIGIALLGALEVAHALSVLHRDVKPANVLICSDGRCVLTDFGVARMPTDVQLTTPGMVLGSPHFISPERAMGQEFGPPSDLFSLGVTLYTAVEGRPPFDKGDPIETMHAVVEDPPATPQRSGPLTGVLMGLLEKDPARRLDVHRARAMLRELLAGPLTSTATAVNSVTDPYAVVPVSRPAPPPVVAAEPKPAGQIGGRAMIGPGESLTDRLASLRRGERPGAAPAAGAAALDETSADALAGPLHTPTGAMSGPDATDATQRISPDATVRFGQGAGGDATQRVPTGPPATYGGGVDATQPVYGGGAQWSVPGTGQPWTTPATAPGDGGQASGLLGKVKAWPRKVQLAAAGGLAVVLLVGVIALTGGGDDAPPPIVGTLPSNSAAAPPVEMQERTVKGVTIQVPKGWQQQTGGLYVDYVDPEDEGRKVRVIAEKWGGTSITWAEFASRNLKSKTANSKTCPAPYNELSVSEQPLAGQPAGQLEYTCGEGETMRHGIWRGLVKDGKVYSFYLSSTDARFAESKPIFDAMAGSFQLTAAN
ncbi:serine/threonine-protein kinase [Micromonospora robiginosa]|uniref:non-specific serine/threonine protein kinase n=1 Tax=Micromonospora robiginosa TaxID=2749844 RepID=A0A7L6BC45_9ACTN|nr:serine/threonine-protein kinase [Micromonospora ferruginea]QLQ39240.1 serine/threonine-protein kinase [Micromonospora ferruginea]